MSNYKQNSEIDHNHLNLNSSINSNSLDIKSSTENLVATNQFSSGNFKVNVNVKFKYNNNLDNNDNDLKMNNLLDNNEINKIDNNNLNNGDDNSLLNYRNIHDKSINKLFNSINFVPDLTSTPSKKIIEDTKENKNLNRSESKLIKNNNNNNNIKSTIESNKILNGKYDKLNTIKILSANRSPNNKSPTKLSKINELSPPPSTKRLSPNRSPIRSPNNKSPTKLSTNRSPNKSPTKEIDKKLTTNTNNNSYDDKNLNYSDEQDDLYGSSTSPTFSDYSFLSNNSSASKNSQLTDQLYSIDPNTNPVVQVSIRIRPMNKIEITNPQIKKIVDVDETNSVLLLKDRRSTNETRFKFKFKNIFYSKTTKTDNENQEEIFSKIGQPFIKDLLDGNDLSYFAYGQTGSGKSYTIMGNEQTSGIVFRFARDLFEIVNLNKCKDLDKLFSKLNCLEMNRDLRDASSVNNTTSFTDNNSSPLLIAKNKLYENSKLYDDQDVIDGYNATNELIKLTKQIDNNNSFTEFVNHHHNNSTCKNRILRFNEKIQIFSDDDISYNEKLASDSETSSSLDSLKNFDKNEETIGLLDNENLKILRNLFIKFDNSNYYDLKINFQFKMSFYEIYSECIYDLLEPNEERLKSKIREHPTTGPFIENLTMKEIHNLKELTEYYEIANKRRSKSKTNLNERSSRSHAVCTIYINQIHNYTVKANFVNQLSSSSKFRTAILNSKITFVDLAGSERALSSDQLSNERLKEGNSINKSLLTLGKVITKLAWINKCIKEKKDNDFNNVTTTNPLYHVPYRDSILTWLLKDCFNGKCKTFMIATIAPTSNHYDQTLSTLRYAYKASKIKVPIKLNQLTLNRSSNHQKQSSSPPHQQQQQINNSKRIYIEQLDNIKEKHRLERKKLVNDLNEKSELKKDQLDNIKEEDGEEDESELKNKKYLDDKDQLINMKEYLNNKKTIDNLSKNIYSSNLLDKIRNLFKEYI